MRNVSLDNSSSSFLPSEFTDSLNLSNISFALSTVSGCCMFPPPLFDNEFWYSVPYFLYAFLNAPINLYGATKLTSDKLFIAANNIKGYQDIKFSVVRYGNVMGSNGSVIPFFIKKRETGVLPITDLNMTRFNISLEAGVNMVLHAMSNSWGGELYVPKIPSYRITDIAKAVGPKCEMKVVGIRPGEKIHEEMITASDSYNTYDIGTYYVILPTEPVWNTGEYIKINNAKLVEPGFSYNSGQNTSWETIESLRSLIKEHLYPNFEF